MLTDEILSELGVPEFIRLAKNAAIAREIAVLPSDVTQQVNPQRLPRIAYIFEAKGLSKYNDFILGNQQQDETPQYFEQAFLCWRALASLPSPDGVSDGLFAVVDDPISSDGLHLLAEELSGDPLDPELNLAFRIAVSGLLANRNSDVRLSLLRIQKPVQVEDLDWQKRVTQTLFSAFVCLVRKAGGWDDIDRAIELIAILRENQKQYEETYLNNKGDELQQAFAAAELVGLYHLAQLVTITGTYLSEGRESQSQINVRVDRHHERANEAFDASQNALFRHLSSLLWAGCRKLVQDALWSHLQGLGEDLNNFGRLLLERGRPNPVIELWPGQQKVLSGGFFDTYRSAILVEMPTSAGKTLLAKFAIVRAKTLNRQGTIVYIVPTRALVNQVTLDLRADFQKFGDPPLRVEQAVPATELDPNESRLLQDVPDVLVSTPEKFDLLIRKDHVVTKDISLVIVDEAHNLRDETRGVRLELLLGTIKRDRPQSRFLLLSPFLPNHAELLTWLGGDRAAPIKVNWQPGEKIVGAVEVAENTERVKELIFETLPASSNVTTQAGMKIIVAERAETSTTLKGITLQATKAFESRGGVLVLCHGSAYAEERAKEIADTRTDRTVTRECEAICRYLEAETGRLSRLVQCIRKGVAFHHAGISHEARWLVESLIRRKDVEVVCGTTTLAQGMNFPISTVIVETLRKGERDRLGYDEFWNIAGRAGRALMDNVGIIAFPTRHLADKHDYTDFLRGEAEDIASQLALLVVNADEISENFSIKSLKEHPQLSSLLQFLAHAMRVSGSDKMADEVEDILRASLVYYQLQKQDRGSTLKLIKICRAYLESLASKKNILPLADQTGFATPSVLNILSKARRSTELNEPNNWQPSRIFDTNDIKPLKARIEAIADLPEMNLGESRQYPYSPELTAQIVRDWVRGDTLSSLADRYGRSSGNGDREKKLSAFNKHLFGKIISQASWGIGALESVCFAGKEVDNEEAGYIPAMVFFGVRSKEAVWLRSAGVPRVIAENLADRWKKEQNDSPNSYQEIRNWVGAISETEWSGIIPKASSLTGGDLKILWEQFAG